MTKRILGVDVDGVIVDTLSLYKEASEQLEDPLDFWRSDSLYDNLEPIKGSVEKLQQLSQYFSLVFISRLKGNHHRSKVYFTKKWFPFQEGFIGTHEKYLMNNSVVAMIDDLSENLVGFDHHKRVKYGFDCMNTSGCAFGYTIKDWESFSVKDFCDQYLN